MRMYEELIKRALENDELAPAKAAIARFVLENPLKAAAMKTGDIGKAVYVHGSATGRMAKDLGYKGWQDMKDDIVSCILEEERQIPGGEKLPYRKLSRNRLVEEARENDSDSTGNVSDNSGKSTMGNKPSDSKVDWNRDSLSRISIERSHLSRLRAALMAWMAYHSITMSGRHNTDVETAIDAAQARQRAVESTKAALRLSEELNRDPTDSPSDTG